MSGVLWDATASRSPSGIQAAGLQGRCHSIDRQHISCQPIVHLMLIREAHHVFKTVDHDLFQPSVDELLVPEESLAVLHPLEIGYGDTSRISENVWDHKD